MTAPVIGRRTRRRGALDKAVTFALARAARLAAAPPLPSSFGPPRPLRLAGPVAFVASAFPWEPLGPPPGQTAVPALVVVACEGRFFAGSYELLERERRARGEVSIVASDVFVSPAQVERARRAGADGVAPVVRAPGASFEAVARAAVDRQMALLPECASADDVERAAAAGANAALISVRDRDTHRPDIDAADVTLRACRAAGLPSVALFVSSLEEDLRGRAAELGFDHVAC